MKPLDAVGSQERATSDIPKNLLLGFLYLKELLLPFAAKDTYKCRIWVLEKNQEEQLFSKVLAKCNELVSTLKSHQSAGAGLWMAVEGLHLLFWQIVAILIQRPNKSQKETKILERKQCWCFPGFMGWVCFVSGSILWEITPYIPLLLLTSKEEQSPHLIIDVDSVCQADLFQHIKPRRWLPKTSAFCWVWNWTISSFATSLPLNALSSPSWTKTYSTTDSCMPSQLFMASSFW